MRTHQLNSENVAVIVAEAAQVGSDRVAIYLDGTTTLGGIATTFGPGRTALPGGGSVWGLPNEYVVVWPDNSQLWVTLSGYYMGADIFLADARRGNVTGLLGNANGDPTDDLTTRDGMTTLSSPTSFEDFYGTYVKSWWVTAPTSPASPGSSLFTYPDGENTASPDIRNPNFPVQLETVDSLSADQVQAAEAICVAAGVTSDWMDACELDVALAPAADAQDTAMAYVGAPPVTATFDIQPPASVTGTPPGDAGTGDAAAGGGDGSAQSCSPPNGCVGPCVYRASCLDILNAGESTGDGTYWINPPLAGSPFQAYCDMTTDGGGWTRVVGINAADYNHVNNAAVNPCGMTTATALGKFSDVLINALKSGSDPAFRLTCANSTTPVTGYFSSTCTFDATPSDNATGTCTAAAYTYAQPEVYGGEFSQSCIVGLADGTHATAERLIYGANANICPNTTTGCDTQYAHWSGNGSLWVR